MLLWRHYVFQRHIQMVEASDAAANQSATAKTYETTVLRSVSELEEIRLFWEAWPGNRDSDLDFYITVLSQSRDCIRPHIILILKEGKPDAIFVGRLEIARLDRVRVGYIRVRPRVKILYFVYGALRGNCSFENCQIIIAEVCKSLAEGEADLAYLNFLREDTDLCRLALKMPGILYRDRIRGTQKHYIARLPGTVEEFRRRLPSTLPKNRHWNKMNRDLGKSVRIRCFKDLAEIDALANVVEGIARRSYQRGIGVGFVNTAEERRRLTILAEKGGLRAYVIYIDDNPAAFWIGDINDEIFGSDSLGYDPAFGKYSPGMYLILKVMEGAFNGADKISGFDFATGHAGYKETLSTDVWRETDVYIFAPSLRGVAMNALKTMVVGIDQTLKIVLRRTGLLERIKKGWRRQAAKGKVRL